MDRTIAVIKQLVYRESVLAAMVLLALLHLCFFPCIWGNKTLLESARDQSSIMRAGAWAGSPLVMAFPKMLDTGAPAWVPEPLLALIGSDYAKERSMPLWNPYQAYGLPLAANMQSQPFYPLSIALSLHLTPRTYSWFILLRLYLAGICAYLFVRFFVSFMPALAAGVTSMLAGYYVLFITMPHLSVEVLLPAALLAGERLLRRPRYWTVVWFAVVIFLVMVGGMPESSLMLFTFLYLYLAVRIGADPRLRSRWSNRTLHVLVATVAGLGLSALLLLPFREYMTLAFDMHQPSNIGGSITGLGNDPRNLSILTYLFPLLYGPPFSSTLSPGWNGLRNYAGLISLFLALISLCGCSWRRGRRDRLLSSLTIFFALSVVVAVLKRYGFAPVNLIGTLPFFKLVQFPKYEEVILSISVSMLCAIGLERLIRRQVSIIAQTAALAAVFLAVPLTLILSRQMLSKEVLLDHVSLGFPLWALGLPVCLLFSVAILLVTCNSNSPGDNLRPQSVARVLTTGLFIILAGETAFNYLIPAYYAFNNKLPTRAANPYLGAPFIRQLKARAGHFRVFAEDAILFPNWASAFRLFDIRALDAMYYNRYFPFLRAFSPPKARGYGDELEDRFTGQGAFEFANILQRRLLQLSSVKYFMTMRPVTLPSTIVEGILSQARGHVVNGKENFISRQSFVLDGTAREALGEHPPYDRLPYSLKVEKGNEDLHFSYALNPAVYEHTCGDGVEFILEARSASGGIDKLFSSYIDPKHNVKERHWMDGSVDLSRYRGQYIELLLSTNGGPKGDTCNDWAAWSNFGHDNGENGLRNPFKLVYDQEVKIYEYPEVLPRAAVYYNALIRKGEGEVLSELADPNLDIFQSVVLDGSRLNDHQRALVKTMNSTPGLVKPAEITSYESRRVAIEATLDRSGILVLNDSNYPGWDVYVDGHKDDMLSANYLFRGVPLTPGKHIVRFVYNPLSFRIGSAISLASFAFLTVWGFIHRRIRRSERFSRSKARVSVIAS